MYFIRKLRQAKPHGSFILVALLLCLQGTFVIWSSSKENNHEIWRALISLPMWPPYADLLAITEGWDESVAGRDPLRIDQDPPLYNYPRLWLLGAKFGLRSSDAKWLGAIWVLSFLAATCAIIAQAPRWTRLLFSVVMLSPAIWLALERGNSDLIIFAMLTPALLAQPKSGWLKQWPSLVILLSAFLKFFPAVCLAVNLHNIEKKSWRMTTALVLIFILYITTTRHDVQAVLNKTAYGSRESYGSTIAADKLYSRLKAQLSSIYNDFNFPENKLAQETGSRLIILIIIGSAWWTANKHGLIRNTYGKTTYEPKIARLFIAGSLIYISTFFLGSNWAYRLIFLIWTLPLLAQNLISKNHSKQIWAAGSICAIWIVCWQLADKSNYDAPFGHFVSITLIYVLARQTALLIPPIYKIQNSK